MIVETSCTNIMVAKNNLWLNEDYILQFDWKNSPKVLFLERKKNHTKLVKVVLNSEFHMYKILNSKILLLRQNSN